MTDPTSVSSNHPKVNGFNYIDNLKGEDNNEMTKVNHGLDLTPETNSQPFPSENVQIVTHLTSPYGLEKVGENKKIRWRNNFFLRHFGGITLTLLASILSSTNLILVKLLQKAGFTAPESTFWGYFGVFLPSIPLILYFECREKCRSVERRQNNGNDKVFDSVWPWRVSERKINAIGLVVQAFFGAGSILFRFYALQYISVGDTAVISVGSPVLVTILGHFLLREKTGIIPILMAMFALLGVFIISRPPLFTGSTTFDTQTLTGTGFAVLSLVCTALQTIIWRKIRGVQYAVQLLVSGFIGFTVPLIVALVMNYGIFNFPQNSMDILMTGTVAAFGFGVTLFMMLALKMETAGIVSLVRTCDALFGFLLQFLLFAIAPDIYSSLGGLIICFGVLVTGFRKYLETIPMDEGSSRWRKYFGFLLR